MRSHDNHIYRAHWGQTTHASSEYCYLFKWLSPDRSHSSHTTHLFWKTNGHAVQMSNDCGIHAVTAGKCTHTSTVVGCLPGSNNLWLNKPRGGFLLPTQKTKNTRKQVTATKDKWLQADSLPFRQKVFCLLKVRRWHNLLSSFPHVSVVCVSSFVSICLALCLQAGQKIQAESQEEASEKPKGEQRSHQKLQVPLSNWKLRYDCCQELNVTRRPHSSFFRVVRSLSNRAITTTAKTKHCRADQMSHQPPSCWLSHHQVVSNPLHKFTLICKHCPIINTFSETRSKAEAEIRWLHSCCVLT